jgi:serine/threonine protein kinase
MLDLPASGRAFSDVTADCSEPGSERLGSVIGPYKLLQKIGEGGMGTVYMAQQSAPVRRLVALKLIKPGMDSRQVIARFEAERQALALMDHPNIAKVLDAGTTGGKDEGGRMKDEKEAGSPADSSFILHPSSFQAGRPFFVMELVKGVPITKYCDDHHLTPRERLELFIPVCQAVQHAHNKGIIHRDVKPSNVMVCIYDGKPVPKIIDFGVAKATGQQLTERTLFTEFGAIVGTFEYMSPEQAQLDQLDIDTRSDIYSLGVLLYELLTGTTPLERRRVKEVALLELLRLVREEEAPRPSTRLSTAEGLPSIAANRSTEPKKLTGLLRGELDWIVLKALEKDRNRRYETANGLAQEIERYLNDEAVQACPPSLKYQLKKFIRRNRGGFVAAVIVLACLLGGITGTTIGLFRAEQQKQLAEANEQKATRAALEAQQAQARESEERAAAEKARDRARQALDAMTSSMIGDSLTTQKELSGDQKKFLNEVLSYYHEFAGEKADDEKSRAGTSAAAFRVGMIESRLGRKEQSVRATKWRVTVSPTSVPVFLHQSRTAWNWLEAATTLAINWQILEN